MRNFVFVIVLLLAASIAARAQQQEKPFIQDRYIRLHILFSRDAHRNARDEHRAILELCRQRNAAAASQLLEDHITRAGREMKEFIKKEFVVPASAGISAAKTSG